jgi:hypothetical protein
MEFAVALVKCDSCFVYVKEDQESVLRAVTPVTHVQ